MECKSFVLSTQSNTNFVCFSCKDSVCFFVSTETEEALIHFLVALSFNQIYIKKTEQNITKKTGTRSLFVTIIFLGSFEIRTDSYERYGADGTETRTERILSTARISVTSWSGLVNLTPVSSTNT